MSHRHKHFFLQLIPWGVSLLLNVSCQTMSASTEIYTSQLQFADPFSNAFSQPEDKDLKVFYLLVREILSGNLEVHEKQLDHLGYRLELLKDGVIALKANRTHGGGTYLFRLSSPNHYIIEVPHPVFDNGTLEESSYLFDRLKARALFIAGTHRCANQSKTTCSGKTRVCSGSLEAYRTSDVAHNTKSFFHQAHKAAFDDNVKSLSFSIHAQKAEAPTASISNGLTENSTKALSNHLAKNLEPLVPGKINSCNDEKGSNILCGTTNVQGRYSNSSKNPCSLDATQDQQRFIHIEQNEVLRTTPKYWEQLADSIEKIFP